ncbi:MAG: hypothetical protein Q9221_008974 [Calogaya cf. arnoldii]
MTDSRVRKEGFGEQALAAKLDVVEPVYDYIKSLRDSEAQPHHLPFECQGPSTASRIYALGSLLEKLEYKFELTIFELAKLEIKVPYAVAPWQKPPTIRIALTDEIAQKRHNEAIAEGTNQFVDTDGSGINGQIAAAAIKTLSIMDGHDRQPEEHASVQIGTHRVRGRTAWNALRIKDGRGGSKANHHLHGQPSSNPGDPHPRISSGQYEVGGRKEAALRPPEKMGTLVCTSKTQIKTKASTSLELGRARDGDHLWEDDPETLPRARQEDSVLVQRGVTPSVHIDYGYKSREIGLKHFLHIIKAASNPYAHTVHQIRLVCSDLSELENKWFRPLSHREEDLKVYLT